jgi:hypothetical protein
VLEITTDGQTRSLLEYPKSDRALCGIVAGPDGALYLTEYGSSANKITRLTPNE